jgi:hypothetical protein
VVSRSDAAERAMATTLSIFKAYECSPERWLTTPPQPSCSASLAVTFSTSFMLGEASVR